jgi:DNA polymerase III delta prime subunit
MLGFIDYDGYITHSFDYLGGFNLVQSSRHNLKLKNFLQEHIFEAVTRVFVNSSITLEELNSTLSIFTPSDQLIKLIVTLNNASSTTFLPDPKLYSTAKITEEGKKIELQYYYQDMKNIINQLRINQNFSSSTEAVFLINDQLNPVFNKTIPLPKSLFHPNRSP